MDELIRNLNLPNLSGLIIAITSIIGLFVFNRQASAAERALRLKIVEVQELAKRIDEESKDREALFKLHEKEVLERIENITNLWRHINYVTDSDSEIEHSKKIIDFNNTIDLINVNTYITVLIRDICILLFQAQERDFEKSDIKENLGKIFKFLSAYASLRYCDYNRNNLIENAYQQLKSKKEKYDMNKMTSSEIEKAYTVLHKEFSEELERITKESSSEMETCAPQFKIARDELFIIINNLFAKEKEPFNFSE